MSTQKKIFLAMLILVSITIFIGLIAFFIDRKNEIELLHLTENELKDATQLALEDEERRVYNTLFDYTYWDDFLNFVNKPDSIWAEENIHTILSSFDLDAAWIYNLNQELINKPSSNLVNDTVFQTFIFENLHQKRFFRFYTFEGNQPVLVYGATIHGTQDANRLNEPGGYFFLAKILDEALIHRFTKLTGSKITLQNEPKSKSSNIKKETVSSVIPLKKADQSVLTYLVFEKQQPSITFLRQATKKNFWLFSISILLLFLMISIMINKLVSKPLKLTGVIIKQEDTTKIELLNRKSSDFRLIGNLIETSIKQKRELEKTMQLARQSDRLKTAFLNNISHEVRTPLNGIIGASILLTDPDISQEEKQHMSDLIQLSTQRLIRTITEYMDISLLNSDSMPFYPKLFDLGELINKLNHDFQLECQIKELKYITQMEGISTSETIFNDKDLLDKILRHLLDNATKFTSKGHVIFSVKKAEHNIIFTVEDSGIGIDESFHTKLFSVFEQEDSSNIRRYDGSGLGLAIAHQCSKLVGATINFETKKDIGSKFVLSLPTNM